MRGDEASEEFPARYARVGSAVASFAAASTRDALEEVDDLVAPRSAGYANPSTHAPGAGHESPWPTRSSA